MIKRILKISIIALMILSGIVVLLYPTVSNYLAQQNQSSAIQSYSEKVENLNEEEIERQRKLAQEYNDALVGVGITDPFIISSGTIIPDNYFEIMDFGDGLMGNVEIPKIDANLPIYHGTNETVLQKGVGHLSATSLPIGGEGNHSVITGHSGLPTSKLFTDLDQLEMGDIFYLNILNETLTYQVDQILVVDPGDTQELQPKPGKDYVTLITCTPYSVNTHRLFVRGIRIPNIEEVNTGDVSTAEEASNLFWIVGSIIVAVIILIVALILMKRRNNGKKQEERDIEKQLTFI